MLRDESSSGRGFSGGARSIVSSGDGICANDWEETSSVCSNGSTDAVDDGADAVDDVVDAVDDGADAVDDVADAVDDVADAVDNGSSTVDWTNV